MGEGATAGGVVRASVDGVEPCAEGAQTGRYLVLHRGEVFPTEVTTADAGLVGYQHDGNVALVRGRYRRGGAGRHHDVLDPAEVTRILYDHAVAIEEQGGAAAPRAGPDFAPDSFEVYRMRSGRCCRVARRHSPSG